MIKLKEIEKIDREIEKLKIETEVIMKMARIRIQNCDNSNQVDANMLLDTGAKRTYITLGKAQKLGLKIGPKREVKLNTFGSTKTSNMLVQETDLIIKQKDGSKKTVCAKICKNICSFRN